MRFARYQMLSDVIRLTMNMMLYEIEADIIGFAIYGTLIGSFCAVILNVSNNHRTFSNPSHSSLDWFFRTSLIGKSSLWNEICEKPVRPLNEKNERHLIYCFNACVLWTSKSSLRSLMGELPEWMSEWFCWCVLGGFWMNDWCPRKGWDWGHQSLQRCILNTITLLFAAILGGKEDKLCIYFSHLN